MPDKLLDRLLARPRFGSGLPLHRMSTLVARLPGYKKLLRVDPIRVTGSNGKGTVTMLAAALLKELGFRVGQFISPHVSQFEERIQIAGNIIGVVALAEALAWFEREEAAYKRNHPEAIFGAFEAITAVALYAFAQADLDALVLEAGIGGRYDTTRVVEGRVVGLTSVDLEHTAILGPTLEHILYDKADLASPGGVLIAGHLPASLDEKLDAYAGLCHMETNHIASIATLKIHRLAAGQSEAALSCNGVDFGTLHFTLTGETQLWNAAHALALVQTWLARNNHHVANEELRAAAQRVFATTVIPLRFEKIAADPDIYIDAAHTPAAAQALAETLTATLKETPLVLLLGISKDKAARDILAPLLPRAACVVVANPHRGLDVEALAATAHSQTPSKDVIACANLRAALARAQQEAKARDGSVIVAGSFYLAAEVRALLAGEDPTRLRFL